MKDKIINLYNKGCSMPEISKELGISVGAVRKILLQNNIEIRHQGKPTYLEFLIYKRQIFKKKENN